MRRIRRVEVEVEVEEEEEEALWSWVEEREGGERRDKEEEAIVGFWVEIGEWRI